MTDQQEPDFSVEAAAMSDLEYRESARRCRREALIRTKRRQRLKPLPGGNGFRPAHWGYDEWRDMARFWQGRQR